MNESMALDSAFDASVCNESVAELESSQLTGPMIAPASGGASTACGPDISHWARDLAGLADAGDDAGGIDQIRQLEDIKSACAAAQARITAAFAASQRASNAPRPGETSHADGDAGHDPHVCPDGDTVADAGWDADPDVSEMRRVGGGSRAQQWARRRAKAERLARRSAAAQVALARRESPQRGGRFVGLADVLTGEMPNTLAALASGVINEWRAMIIVRDTACLTAEQRRQVDGEIAGKLDGLGDARIHALVTAIGYRLDPEAATSRAVCAVSDRRVAVRPAPDAMAYLSGLMPVATAVACYASLCRHVDARPGLAGDTRTRDQRIVDEFIARLTGPAVGNRTGAGPADISAGAGAAGAGDVGAPRADAGAAGVSGRADAGAGNGGEVPEAADRAPDAGVSGGSEVAATELGSRADLGDADRASSDPVAAVRAAYERAVARPANAGAGRAGSAGNAASASNAASAGSTVRVGSAASADNAVSADAENLARVAAHTPGVAGRAIRGAERRGPNPRHGPAWGIPPGTDVMLNVVITDRTLLAGGDDPAILQGNHPIPAPLVRWMLADCPAEARVWIRRLYTRPNTGELVAQESRRREFPPAMRRLLLTRDQTCRTPWCNAPARHADHLRPAAVGGATRLGNGQGLSEDCNYIRTAPGWSARCDPARSGDIEVTTPTGHRYHSPCPDVVPGHTRDAHPPADVCYHAEQLLEWHLARTG